MIIRKATKKDFSKLAKLIDKEYSKPPYNERWKKKNALRTFDYFAKVGEIFILVDDNKIIGFIISRNEHYNKGSSVMIEDLVVDSDFQGKGYGRLLVNYVEERGKKKKIKGIWLMASKNAPAFHFYKKMGYTLNKKTVLFYKELR